MSSMKAYVDDFGKITVVVSRRFFGGETGGFYLCTDDGRRYDCLIRGRSELNGDVVYELTIPADLSFGERFMLREMHGSTAPVKLRHIVRTQVFHKMFTYDGDDLGSRYFKDHTEFALWAPTAVSVFVRILNNGKESVYPMERTEKGVYRASVKGDLKRALYLYLVERNGEMVESLDPYGFSSSANGAMSAVINLEEVMAITDPGTFSVENPCDAVIYECSVRDMTSSLQTGTSTHGKFVSLYENGTSYNGEETGIDYLASLGITHVQLQPVIDFATVDEQHPSRNYNWGYDPAQIFALEGSYSTDPNDPYARMKEFRTLVREFHERNIRVTLDVVWNHMYEVAGNALGMTVPYYYYRVNDAGYLSNGSYCGDDIATERPMTRNLLRFAARFLMKTYGIDGFRFDLMGLIDIDTMNLMADDIRKIKPDALIYGEGWDMPTQLPSDSKSTIANQERMPGIGHFNDTFRDVLKGKTGDNDKYARGYLTGNRDMAFDACSALSGHAAGHPYFRRFTDPSKSINAMETHDNATIWDKMHACCNDEPREVRMKRMRLMIACTMLAQGVPFLHQGQEFAGTKSDNSNSYNAGDEINQMNWERRMLNIDTVEYTKRCISYRRSQPLFRLRTGEEVMKRVRFTLCDNGCLIYDIDGRDLGRGRVRALINPNRDQFVCGLDEEWTVRFNADGYTENDPVRCVTVPMCSVVVLENHG
ncbi:MAG: type I pullulanase [Solobacterium sp.]|nr:type I pullulanase [Solobacterium sp.]